MKISKINLLNFRNYSKLNLQLNENMNIFIGNNAQGKTNILESIHLLALTKSYRSINDFDLVKFGKDKAIIKGRIKNNGIIKDLEISLEKGKKTLYLNKNIIKRTADYISNLLIISFSPDDLEIIKDSPSVRRNILNIQISQLSKLYLNTYNEYNKLLKTRNEYLKLLLTNSLSDKNYFDIITEKLIEKAVIIYKMRKEYIDLVNINLSSIYSEIGTTNDELSIVYEPNVEIIDFSDDSILNNGMTLFGPHRDDFSFLLNNNNLKMYGSQGQQKLAIISYKLSEISIFEDMSGNKPILLFDDIFSELDIKKRNRLLKYVENNIQSIITTTDIKNINKKFLSNASIFEVIDGNIVRK